MTEPRDEPPATSRGHSRTSSTARHVRRRSVGLTKGNLSGFRRHLPTRRLVTVYDRGSMIAGAGLCVLAGFSRQDWIFGATIAAVVLPAASIFGRAMFAPLFQASKDVQDELTQRLNKTVMIVAAGLALTVLRVFADPSAFPSGDGALVAISVVVSVAVLLNAVESVRIFNTACPKVKRLSRRQRRYRLLTKPRMPRRTRPSSRPRSTLRSVLRRHVAT